MDLTLADLETVTDQQNLVAFRLDQQTYALPIESIVQIIEMVSITPIPQVSNTVEGVINVRGVLVPVINLRRYFALPETALQLHTPIVLAQIGELMVGLIVDEVLDVLSLPGDQITRSADILPEGWDKSPIWQGLAHTPNSLVLLLDLDHLFLPQQALTLARAVKTLPEVAVPVPGADEGEEASEDVGAASAQVGPQLARPRRKERRCTSDPSVDKGRKMSQEAHLDEPDWEVGA